ncbi:unnamed protein product [Rotaria sp. Silwood2]|nr:unnamed protein product [Rotaria sp. Silwood2]CAF2868164.1 unnamed protein product [Rotaria sp. Silwood2]CAF3341731.1 unnamed protein product [Rotaria sp. Silwood2]CAF3935024.1 unnamed protein product [Rotaria sp. Silwood2]CAF4171399.1 unnamed protein product [Rotaria sp. Silwood2]
MATRFQSLHEDFCDVDGHLISPPGTYLAGVADAVTVYHYPGYCPSGGPSYGPDFSCGYRTYVICLCEDNNIR